MRKKSVLLAIGITAALLLSLLGGYGFSVNAVQTQQVTILQADGEGTPYGSLAEAVSAAQDGSVLQLNSNVTGGQTVNKSITLDLNGYSISGTVTVSGNNVLTVKDSATDDYSVQGGYGQLRASGNVRAAEGYIAVTEGDATSFHRVTMEICSVNLRTSVAGIYYSSNFGGDETVKAQLAGYGVALSVYEVPTAEGIANNDFPGSYTAFSADSWVCGEAGKKNGTLLSGIMKQSNTVAKNADNAKMDVYGVAYVKLKDGSVIVSDNVVVNLQETVEAADTLWGSLSKPQKAGMQSMYATYKTLMDTWEIPNLKAELSGPGFYGSEVTGNGGDTVTVEVSVRNNPGILGMLLSVEYDEGVLTLTNAANGAATAELTYQSPSRLVSGCNFLWYGSRTGEVTDGTVLILTFKIAVNAHEGTYPVKVICSSQDTYDGSYNPIEAAVTDGAVTVAGQPPVASYTVTFKDYNGNILKTETVEEGKAATAPADPVREGYVFVGWDKAFSNVTGDLTVTALYEQETTGPKLYGSKVTALSGDTVSVEVSVKNNPGILGMLLSVEYDESVLTLTGTANGSATSALTYLAPSRLVSGCNFLWYGTRTGQITDGTVLILTFKVAQDAAAGTYPIELAYSSEDTYDGDYYPIVAAVADGAITVSGQPEVVKHTVIFRDYDGRVLKRELVEDGKSATAPAEPVRDGYVFIGWDKNFSNITANLVVTAQYEEEVTGPKFYASRETASAGDTVTVTVSIKNNPGILGLLLSLEYDESVLTLTGTSNGSTVSELTYLEPSRLESGANYLWYGSRTGTVTDGSLLVLTFKVANGAAAGTYPIRLTYSEQDTYDGNYEPVIATVADGAVIVG